MSESADNLRRASKLIRRLADIGGPSEFEGASLSSIAADCALAASEMRHAELQRVFVREFHCNPDESAGMAEIVELHGHSRKAPCA